MKDQLRFLDQAWNGDGYRPDVAVFSKPGQAGTGGRETKSLTSMEVTGALMRQSP